MTMPTNPSGDIAHLGHVEMLTDRFDDSLDFFLRVFGLKLSGRDETSAYLRAWDDYEFCSLKLTRAATTGVGHIARRDETGGVCAAGTVRTTRKLFDGRVCPAPSAALRKFGQN